MAKAITHIEKHIPDHVEEEAQAIQQILEAAAKHRDALLSFMDVLEELKQLGILDAIQGALKNSKQIALIGVDQLNKPGAHRIIKNGMGAVSFLSQMEPGKLQTLLNGVIAGVDHAVDPGAAQKKPGLWDMFRTIRQPEAMSSLNMMTRFLQGMGSGLNNRH
ncbi:DUF1641 domain-containing protein [Paenibacillus aestuarii]|uniref:DUF1641 domain-containing protein n=1 Tax=Paenibacillus aestuarii TaxID=516965 RepID=A0ABW0K2P2_9BACL|nr:hypothetical protein [Paenibacillus aestuarii]